jgi:hypothetical protein
MTPLGRPRQRALVTAGVVTLLSAAAVHAQTDPTRPFRSPLEGTRGTGHNVELSAALFEGYDFGVDRRVVDVGGVPPVDGFYTMTTPGLVWHMDSTRMAVGASAGAVVRYADETGRIEVLERAGAFAWRTAFGRTALLVEQSASLRNYYDFSVLSVDSPGFGELPAFHPEESTVERPMFAYAGSVGLSRQVGRHLWVAGRYIYRYDTVGRAVEGAVGDFRQYTHDGRFSVVRQIGRQTRLNIGYAAQSVTSNDPRRAPALLHQFDLGLQHGQGFALGRNTKLSVAGGPGIIDSQDGTHVVAVGDATLNQRFGRSWTALITGRRSIVYAEGFADPLLTNGVSAEIKGELNRRTRLTAAYRMADGDTKPQPGRSSVLTRATTVNLTRQIARRLDLFVEFFDFHQAVSQHGLLPGGIAEGLWDRRGVRAGFTVAVPLSSERGVE